MEQEVGSRKNEFVIVPPKSFHILCKEDFLKNYLASREGVKKQIKLDVNSRGEEKKRNKWRRGGKGRTFNEASTENKYVINW